jgi:hypothetical protein
MPKHPKPRNLEQYTTADDAAAQLEELAVRLRAWVVL